MVDITKYDVRCRSCNSIVVPEDATYKLYLGLIGAVLLGAAGFVTGGAIGIATAGFGMAATVPLTGFGLIAGYLGGAYTARLYDGITCPECGDRFGSFIPGR